MTRPNVILWDLMDTLVRDPFFTHMAPFFGLSFEELLAQKHPTAWRDFELSRIDEADLFECFFRDGRPIDGPAFRQHVAQAYAWVDGMRELVAELHARGVPMYALSNYPPWYRLADERLGLSDYVQLSFVSCHTGHRKPAPEAYLHACRSLSLAPEEVLFVDDREVNCEAARTLGLHSVRFEAAEPLRAALGGLGLLEK